jgi:hypothetical protein
VRRRGPGDRPPPPPQSPSQPPSPSSATRGEGGGRGDNQGRGSALSPRAQLRWRGEVPGAAAAASGEPAGASAASGPYTAEAQSVPRRGPPAGGPTFSLPPPPPPLGRGRSQREERPRAGRRTAGRGPQRPGGLRDSRVLSALGLQRAQSERDPSSLLRQAVAPTHSLCHPPFLPRSPEATEPGRCPGAPPSPTPLPSSRQSSQSPISRDFPPDRPDPAQDTSAYARAPSRERANPFAGWSTSVARFLNLCPAVP